MNLRFIEAMAKRSTRSPSKVFANVLAQAEKRLILDAEKAENLGHKGLKGNERAAALKDFLEEHLPAIFAVGSGEAIDFRDHRTGELDLFIYDRSTAAPIQSSSESALIPAESLYAVIEVKTTLSQDELNKCFKAAARVRKLKPFKTNFRPAATDGQVFEDHYRCPYYVFSYHSNLAEEDWAEKEHQRLINAAKAEECPIDVVDQLFVLDRGCILPSKAVALEDSEKGVFLDFYVHLLNFLTRERARRPNIDWTVYTSRRKWKKLI